MEELNKLQLWEFATQALVQDFSKKIGEAAGAPESRVNRIHSMAGAIQKIAETAEAVRSAYPYDD